MFSIKANNEESQKKNFEQVYESSPQVPNYDRQGTTALEVNGNDKLLFKCHKLMT